jgi:hypothetical protein
MVIVGWMVSEVGDTGGKTSGVESNGSWKVLERPPV